MFCVFLRQSGILTDELWEDIVYQNTEKNKVTTVKDTNQKGTESFLYLRRSTEIERVSGISSYWNTIDQCSRTGEFGMFV